MTATTAKLIVLLSLSLTGIVVVHGKTTFTIDPWEPGKNYPQFTAIVGDRVDFIYGEGTNDLFLHPDNNCQQKDNIIRIRGVNGPGTYEFQREDGTTWGKTQFFACNTGLQCEQGQHQRVVVFSRHVDREKVQNGMNPQDDFPPPFVTDDPSTAPGAAPAPATEPSEEEEDPPQTGNGNNNNPIQDYDDIFNPQDDDGQSHLSEYWVWYLVALIILCILICCCIAAICLFIIRPAREREHHETRTTTTTTKTTTTNKNRNQQKNDEEEEEP